jgi:hypothetical protein
MTRATVCVAALGLLACAAVAGADTHYVDWDGSAGYTTIQAAMDAAVSDDVVSVASGTYYITDPITYGGKEIWLRSEFNPVDTIIDCQGVTNAVVFVGEGPDAMFSGFTIQNGYSDNYGGAIFCSAGASPTVSDCIIRNCTAQRGGGIYVYQSSISVLSTEITGCTATEWGGGIYCYNSSDAQFIGLTIGENTGGQGGGMYVWGGGPAIHLCTFYRNNGAGGGAIHCRAAGMATVIQTILAFSTAGKGIYCEDGATPYVAYSDIYGNAGGDDVCFSSYSNGNEDPRFCDMDAGDLTLCANSGCLPDGIGPALIGAWGQGCSDCTSPVAPATWGAVKALYR